MAQGSAMNIDTFAGGKPFGGLIHFISHANSANFSLTNHRLRFPLKNNELYWIYCHASQAPGVKGLTHFVSV